MVLQDADSIEDACEILNAYPRTCGINLLVADGKANRAAVVEFTADEIAVRFAAGDTGLIWTTNHFNCFPGWQEYSGADMVRDQDERIGLADISTVEAWQAGLAELGIGPAGRYGRYQGLLHDHHGRITVDVARTIISDRYSTVEGRRLEATEPSAWGDYPICVCRKDWVMSVDMEHYKGSGNGELRVMTGNVSSFVAVPATGDVWLAVGTPPAAYTAGYTHLNLYEELRRKPR